jgi:hypothetical protein
MRTRTLLLLAATATLATIVGLGVAAGGAPAPGRTSGEGGDVAGSAVARAARVLRSWDDARAVAWARGDADSLAELYTPGSATGVRDVTELRQWGQRGLRVEGLRQQVAELRIVRHRRGRLVVRVTDRTVDAIAVSAHRRTALPTSAWRHHRIRLVRRHGRWVVDEVVAQPAR